MNKEGREPDEADFEVPAIPLAADGGPVSGYGAVGQPPPVPPRSPDHFICLRGPCRYYWHLKTMAHEGNPAGTFVEAKKQSHHTCLVNPGFETSFPDDNVYECSRWEPVGEYETVTLSLLREQYYKEHPDHRPENERDK